MTDFRIDLDGYLARIGFAGARTDAGNAVAHRPATSDGHRIRKSELVFRIAGDHRPGCDRAKLIRDGRGGYCHEQNQYLGLALEALGFEVKLRMARVRWMQPPDATPPRAHMTLNVAAGDRWYLCDVGFGAMTPTGPLRLDDEEEQATPHETYRVRQVGFASS